MGGGYLRIVELLAEERCVILDGAVGTELIEVEGSPERDEALWGVGSLLDRPDEVAAVHRRYAEVGCDVISTNTWGLPTALRRRKADGWGGSGPVHWMDVARQA